MILRFLKRVFGWEEPAYKYYAKQCYENNIVRWNGLGGNNE